MFISYRRDDQAVLAHLLADRLRVHLGKDRVFPDVDSICGVMLVLIGPKWLNAVDTKGRRRLDLSFDYVRLEIEAALGRRIRVIPVVVDATAPPEAQDLPRSLRELSYRQAPEISSRSPASGVEQVVGRVVRALDEGSS